MGFPKLEEIVKYGIYGVRELQKFKQGLQPPKPIKILNECGRCEYVFCGQACDNCGFIICSSQ